MSMKEGAQLTPAAIVAELDRYIVGQNKAKRAVAVALRNRWRRQQVEGHLRDEIAPKNIIMIGPTGVGQDRDRPAPGQAGRRAVPQGRGVQVHRGRLRRPRRRLHRPRPDGGLGQAGRDEEAQKVRPQGPRGWPRSACSTCCCRRPSTGGRARSPTGRRGPTRRRQPRGRRRRRHPRKAAQPAQGAASSTTARSRSRSPRTRARSCRSSAAPGSRRWAWAASRTCSATWASSTKRRKLKIPQALEVLTEQEAERLIDLDHVTRESVSRAENAGIVFLDEIDKIAVGGGRPPRRAGRVARGRAARPAAHRRGLHGHHQVRPGADRPRPVHRRRRVPHRQAVRSHPRAAGPVPHPGRARSADRGRLRPHPDRAAQRAHQAVRGAARHRGRRDRVQRRGGVARSRASRPRSTAAPTTSARAACTRSWSACSTSCRSRRPTSAPQTIQITPDYVRQRLTDLAADQEMSNYIL